MHRDAALLQLVLMQLLLERHDLVLNTTAAFVTPSTPITGNYHFAKNLLVFGGFLTKRILLICC